MPNFVGSQIDVPYSDEQAWNGQWGIRIKRNSAKILGTELVAPNSVVGFNGAGISLKPSMSMPTFDIANQNTMAADGSATGTVVDTVTATLMFVYWAGAGAFAGNLAVSQVAPTLSGATGGIYMLGTSGAAAQIRFIGWIYLDSGGNLVDTEASRLVANYYNRRPSRMFLCPNYADDNAATTYARASATWTTIAATAAASRLEYIGNGEDAVHFGLNVTLGAAGPINASLFGLADTNVTNPEVQASFPITEPAKSSIYIAHVPLVVTVGYRTENALVQSGNAVTILADDARNGATADPAATYLSGVVYT